MSYKVGDKVAFTGRSPDDPIKLELCRSVCIAQVIGEPGHETYMVWHPAENRPDAVPILYGPYGEDRLMSRRNW